MTKNISRHAGIYVHLPFCERKCGYCDFFSVTDRTGEQVFINALLREIELLSRAVASSQLFDTVYLGGGTPSVLKVQNIQTIISALKTHFNFIPDTEITIEVNPGTMEQDKYEAYLKAGINRMSIGVQSFDDTELARLERIHTADEARQAIRTARDSGFNNLSIDLIFAIPGQTAKSWQRSLQEAIRFRPEHISAYNLIYEEGTPFYERLLRKQINAASGDKELALFQKTIELLSDAGYLPYEVSSYALDESVISRHNYKYWNFSNYLGLGPSAHSFWQGRRWENVRALQPYSDQLAAKKLPHAVNAVVSGPDLEFEFILLSLRTYAGLDLHLFRERFGHSFVKKYRREVGHLIHEGWARQTEQHFYLTQQGLFICDEILTQFIPD